MRPIGLVLIPPWHFQAFRLASGEGIPVRELKKRGLIPDVRDKVELVVEVLKFFGVATPAEFGAVWSGIQSEWAREKKEIGKGKGEFGVYATRRRMMELKK